MQDPDHQLDGELEAEEIEAYCVRCKQVVLMSDPAPVWTRRGTPGTRGQCSICGTTIFRMGKTEAHDRLAKPDMGRVLGTPMPLRKGRSSQAKFAAYISYSLADSGLAARLAEDLSKAGIPTWFAPDAGVNKANWASGVHPALEECSHMVAILSEFALNTAELREEWAFFRSRRKPILVAQVSPCEIPDDLRTRPRFDFSEDYRTAFRELVQALSG